MIDMAQLTIPIWLILIPCPHHPNDVRLGAIPFHTRAACVAEATKLHLSAHACLRATEAVR
jgi:hypothetical protein